jgi:hypothetical protein
VPRALGCASLAFALDEGPGHLLEDLDLGPATLRDRILSIALDQPAGMECPISGIGQPDLGIGTEPHVTAPAPDLVPEHPGARALVAHHSMSPLTVPSLWRPGPAVLTVLSVSLGIRPSSSPTPKHGLPRTQADDHRSV